MKRRHPSFRIFVDSAHSYCSPERHSPDGSIFEPDYTRKIALRIVEELRKENQNASLVTTDPRPLSIAKRERIINRRCRFRPADANLLVIVHLGMDVDDGFWHNSTGWNIYSPKHNIRADELSETLLSQALQCFKERKIEANWSDGSTSFQQDCMLLGMVKCPAVLTENLFMDNARDVKYLQTEECQEMITRLHVNGILNYIRTTQSANNQ